MQRCFYDKCGNLLKIVEPEEYDAAKDDGPGRTFTYDAAVGQYYLRARFYNPLLGRFNQEDDRYDDGLNLYAYCRNNPVMYADPSGHGTTSATDKWIEAGADPETAKLAAELYPDAKDLYPTYDKYREAGFSPKEAAELARQEIIQGRDVTETRALERMCSEGGSNSTAVSKLTSADVKAAIEKNGMSVDDFSKLLDPNRMLTPDELKFVDRVRADVGLPQAGTVMNKTIPQSDIYNYLYNENYSGVRGFVSVDEHSNTLKTLADVFEGNRLDYNNTAFKTGSGVDGISKSVGNADTVYGKITYVLDDVDGIKVPTDFPTAENAPYTGRGFTGSKNIVLPELVQDMRPFVDGDILGIYDAKTGILMQQFVYDSESGWLLK